MKNLHKLFSLLLVIVLTVACSSNKDDDPTITITTSEFTVVAEQDSEAVATFSVNIDWTISYDGDAKDWLTVTPERGGAGANQSITIKAAANPAAVERKASFSINYGGKPHKLTITQLGKSIDPTITITTSEFTVGAEQDSEAVATFSVNVDWTISYEGDAKDWLTATPEKGGAGIDQTITIKAAANPSETERVAYLTINYGGKPHKLTITQLGKSIDPTITITTSEFTVGAEQDSEAVATFSVNVDWTISYEGDAKDWLTATPEKGKAGIDQTITMKAAENTAPDGRAGYLTINYGGKPHKLTITQASIKETDITAHFDAEFAAKLKEEGYIPDATKILFSDVMNITEINISRVSMTEIKLKSLSGIEYFKALTDLTCVSHQLTALDMSKNTALTSLDCSYNQLTALDMSKNTDLTRLHCYNNKLSALNVSKNTALTELYCPNNELTAFDLSENIALGVLSCFNNELTALDVSKNTALTELSCANNQLTALDLSKNTALTLLMCSNNKLLILDISNNTELMDFDCSFNQLTSLDISKNVALTYLFCSYNPGSEKIFVVKAWFDNENIPAGDFHRKGSFWTLDDKTITIDYQEVI